MPERKERQVAQAAFDIGEDIADELHRVEGCTEILFDLLEEKLAGEPDRGQRALALLEAISRFRAAAAGKAEMLVRISSG